MKKKNTFEVKFIGGPLDGTVLKVDPDNPPDSIIPKFDKKTNVMTFRCPTKDKPIRVYLYKSTLEDWENENVVLTRFHGHTKTRPSDLWASGI